MHTFSSDQQSLFTHRTDRSRKLQTVTCLNPLSIHDEEESTPHQYTVISQPGDMCNQVTTTCVDKGAVSTIMHMHDKLEQGIVVGLSPPFGPFGISAGTNAAVLVSADIGLTPMKAVMDAHGEVVVNSASAPFYAHFEKNT